MNSKKFLGIFLALTVCILGCNAFINYKYDTYGVFDKDFSKLRPAYLNERFAKMDFLLHEGKGKFDTFIFGSSRCKTLKTTMLSGNVYNLSYSAGVPNDYLRDLKILLDNNIRPRKIYVGLDDFDYKRLPEEIHSNINFIGYGSTTDNLKYKIALLFSKPSNDTIRYARGKLTDYQCIYRVNIDGSSGSEKSDSDKNKIDWNKKVYDKIYESPTFVPEKNNRIKKTVAELKEIKRICDDNNIELCLFFTPTHITTYLSDDLNNFNKFKQEVSKISSFYDFSTINFITINNYFWGETSHARSLVLDMVADVLEGRQNDNIPKDFGVLVSEDNIKEHLEKMKNDRVQYLKSEHRQYVPVN